MLSAGEVECCMEDLCHSKRNFGSDLVNSCGSRVKSRSVEVSKWFD